MRENETLKELHQELDNLNNLRLNLENELDEEKRIILNSKVTYIYDLLINPPRNLFEIENELTNLSNLIRISWLESAFKYANAFYKSPLKGTKKLMPSGREINFRYERGLPSDILESDWESTNNVSCVLFSSGMSAITTTLEALKNTKKSKENLKIVTWISYFETVSLLNLLTTIATEQINYTCQEALNSHVQEDLVDIIFIESIRYNWDLEIFNIDELCKAINNRRHKKNLIYIIIDTTLSGTMFDLSKIYEKLEEDVNVMLFEVRSCVKLDQQGLEFSNVGFLKIQSLGHLYKYQLVIHELIKRARTIMGTALSFQEVCSLDFGYFNLSEENVNYQKCVFRNNEFLAKSISCKGIISKVAHPSLDITKNYIWSHAPFVFIHLKDSSLENYKKVFNFIINEVERVTGKVPIGDSFGFRDLRMELVITNGEPQESIIKIAAGAYKSPTLFLLIQVINSLSEFKHVAEIDLSHKNTTYFELT
ncbi:PLP-dependent transferase (plasmid) [Ureibacillus chungkukjangi]|uniref:PLP-dependent transferase n=1 Tax=Ureibacillus chungkukjangi TaxID=1202712 RepID=UPI000D377159|nr:PLP-dependent transferase [Ureibacillus chungkukjangi]MCM3390453.1 PLP-dependent transferase [Ureibacillus chungkukjangi]